MSRLHWDLIHNCSLDCQDLNGILNIFMDYLYNSHNPQIALLAISPLHMLKQLLLEAIVTLSGSSDFSNNKSQQRSVLMVLFVMTSLDPRSELASRMNK